MCIRDSFAGAAFLHLSVSFSRSMLTLGLLKNDRMEKLVEMCIRDRYRSRRWIKTVEGVRKRTGTDETAVCRTVQKISCRCRRFLGGESGKGGNQAEISKY